MRGCVSVCATHHTHTWRRVTQCALSHGERAQRILDRLARRLNCNYYVYNSDESNNQSAVNWGKSIVCKCVCWLSGCLWIYILIILAEKPMNSLISVNFSSFTRQSAPIYTLNTHDMLIMILQIYIYIYEKVLFLGCFLLLLLYSNGVRRRTERGGGGGWAKHTNRRRRKIACCTKDEDSIWSLDSAHARRIFIARRILLSKVDDATLEKRGSRAHSVLLSRGRSERGETRRATEKLTLGNRANDERNTRRNGNKGERSKHCLNKPREEHNRNRETNTRTHTLSSATLNTSPPPQPHTLTATKREVAGGRQRREHWTAEPTTSMYIYIYSLYSIA